MRMITAIKKTLATQKIAGEGKRTFVWRYGADGKRRADKMTETDR